MIGKDLGATLVSLSSARFVMWLRMSEQQQSESEIALGGRACLLRMVSSLGSFTSSRLQASALHSLLRGLLRVCAFLFWVSVTDTTSAAVPANDKFAAAQLILGVEGGVTGSNVGASSQLGEPSHGSIPDRLGAGNRSGIDGIRLSMFERPFRPRAVVRIRFSRFTQE